MIVGPTMPIATMNTPLDTRNRDSSWAKIRACAAVPARPPYSAGHVMPAQPWAASVACQSRHSCTWAASSSADISRPRGLVDAPGGFGSACSVRNARAARRNS